MILIQKSALAEELASRQRAVYASAVDSMVDGASHPRFPVYLTRDRQRRLFPAVNFSFPADKLSLKLNDQ
jgi:hypothetical protein